MGNAKRPPRDAEEARKQRNAQKAELMRKRRAEAKQFGRALTQEERLALQTRGAVIPTPKPIPAAPAKQDAARQVELLDGVRSAEEWARVETTVEEMNRRHAGLGRMMQDLAERRLRPQKDKPAPGMTWEEARRMLMDGVKLEREAVGQGAGDDPGKVQVAEFTQVIIGNKAAVGMMHEALRLARETKKAALVAPK